MGWVKIVGQGFEFTGKIPQADGFEEWLQSTGGAFLDKFIADEGIRFFAKSKAKNILINDLRKTLSTNPPLLAAVNEEVNFSISNVGRIAEKLPGSIATLRVVIVPRILVSEAAGVRLSQELGNSHALLGTQGGRDMVSYFIDQLHSQLDEALALLVLRNKIVPSGNKWFIIDVDPAFEWEKDKSPRGHFIVAKPILPIGMEKRTKEKAKQQEEKILASLGKLSRSEIDALIAQWRLNLE